MKGIDHLASFPHHQLDVYLPKLVRAGLRVAIVDEPLKNDIKTSKMQESKQEKEAAQHPRWNGHIMMPPETLCLLRPRRAMTTTPIMRMIWLLHW